MAPHGATLRGELRYRDGLTRDVDVEVQKNLPSLIAGIKTLSGRVSDLLTDLVLQEKRSETGDQVQEGSGSSDDDDEEEEDEEEEESDGDLEEVQAAEPPAKKSKPVKK
ncbi:unnamed protein product [Merluccius merluccius]